MTARPVPVLVDARPVDHPTARHRGIGRYVTGLLSGLVTAGIEHVALVGSRTEADVLAEAVPGASLDWWRPATIRRVLDRASSSSPWMPPWYVATQAMLHPVTLDPIPQLITQARFAVAAVMYDVIPHRYPERYLVDPAARRLAEVRAPLVRTMDALVAISEFAAETASDVLTFDRDRIAVIGAGVETWFSPAPEGHDPWSRLGDVVPGDVLASRRGLVVAVTGGDERKNTEGLIRAWGRLDTDLRARHHLLVVAALAPAVRDRWTHVAHESGMEVGREITFTGGISDEALVALLRVARLAVMPSLEEGFGLPVLEAVACGTPAICSRVSSLPEVLAEPAATFDPHRPDAIAAAIQAACEDPPHRERLVEAGRRAAERWRWDRVASDMVEALHRLGPRHWSRPGALSRRVALVGPFEGSGSGIGTYDTEFARALGPDHTGDWDHVGDDHPGIELDAFVDTSASPLPVGDTETATPPTCRFPAGALARSIPAHRYDAVIVAVGSSPHHLASVAAARRVMRTGVPVHLWIHEASLVGAEVGLAHRSGSEPWARRHVSAALEANETPQTRARLEGRDILDAETLHAAGVTLIGDLARGAASLIVSSPDAARVLERTLGDLGAKVPPILILPLAHPDRLDDDDSATRRVARVVTVGWLAPNKAPEMVLDAFSKSLEILAAGDEHARQIAAHADVVVVGPVQPGQDAVVMSKARTLGLEDRIRLTGRVDRDTYRDLLATARVAIQLRRDATGQASAAIADLVAAGVPTLTNLDVASTPDGGDLNGGRILVPLDATVIASQMTRLLLDDDLWTRTRQAGLAAASSWGFAHVATAVANWVDDIGVPPAPALSS
jgi:glycosyltransferase involved in cell wall biosynthesis